MTSTAKPEIGTVEKIVVVVILLIIVVAPFLVLVQVLTWFERWGCESKLAYMGLKGTIPPYSTVCYVEFANGTRAPLSQIRWSPTGEKTP